MGALTDPGASELMVWNDTNGAVEFFNVSGQHTLDDTSTALYIYESFTIEVTGEAETVSSAGTGTIKTFRMPYGFNVTEVRASLTTAASGSGLQVDINESTVSILSTKITIDSGGKTSVGATIEPVVGGAGPVIADNAEITIDIDGADSGAAAAGLKVTIIGYQR
jgi:hypothetical protein